ncbi:MAG: hypothetical protein JWN48_5033 [Myxococcaceae bacterium]|nr:hypothetical protein [Myxococcaceae bacterium]
MRRNGLNLSARARWLVGLMGVVGACGSSEPLDSVQANAGESMLPAKAERDAALPVGESAAKGERESDTANVSVSDTGAPPGEGAQPSSSGGCQTFDSSFAAIQALVFERHGCTAAACHGQGKVGGLDLRADAAWASLVDVASSNSANKRVQPGAASESFLYQKLKAASEPGSVQVAGSPMPIGASPLSAHELEAVRLWIAAGGPKEGTVHASSSGLDIGSLLDACLPPASPVKIKPLEPPAPDEGIQLRLPPYVLKAGSEVESCTPFAYDFSNQVPAQYKDTARNVLYTNGSRVRQDPQSHHMVVWNPNLDLTAPRPDAAEWTCHGGSHDGESCDLKKGSADCADGVCAGKPVPGTFCNGDSSSLITGMGTPTLESVAALLEVLATNAGSLPGQIASTQTPQQYTPPLAGVYTEVPLHGIFWFNSHAFNLTTEDTLLESRVNFFYATERKQEMRLMTDSSQVYIAAGTPPFTRKTFCAKSVVPQHYQIATLASHTHRRGEHFWVKDPSGQQIYESFDYSDPAYTRFSPWLLFDAPDEASRTLEYCATYNNGLTRDDKPDLGLVTRASRMPERTSCTPVACVAGKVTAACTTDRDCDSTAGSNDGDCDACPITAGPTTENEMFALMPWYVMPPKP